MDNEAEAQPRRSPWHIIKSVFSWIVTVFAVLMMIFTVVSVLTFDRNDRNIFGFKAFIVLSDSMKATDFAAGDLVLCKNVDPETLEPGDIITYQSVDKDHYGEIITHKIRRRTTDEDGQPAFITYGTTTNTDDNTPVGYSFVLGKYKFHIPKVGHFFQFLKTTPGYIVCILVPFLILILMQGVNSIRLFRQYRREQVEALAAEREKIEQEREDARRQMERERAQSAAMMQELLQLKAQMSGQSGESPPPGGAGGDSSGTAGAPPQGGGVAEQRVPQAPPGSPVSSASQGPPVSGVSQAPQSVQGSSVPSVPQGAQTSGSAPPARAIPLASVPVAPTPGSEKPAKPPVYRPKSASEKTKSEEDGK